MHIMYYTHVICAASRIVRVCYHYETFNTHTHTRQSGSEAGSGGLFGDSSEEEEESGSETETERSKKKKTGEGETSSSEEEDLEQDVCFFKSLSHTDTHTTHISNGIYTAYTHTYQRRL